MADLPDGYYAVLDPADDTAMTYWRIRTGVRTRWPAKAWYGPVRPLRSDAPGPQGSTEYSAWMREVVGLGSECRTGIRTAALAALLTPQIARAHAAHLANGGDDA